MSRDILSHQWSQGNYVEGGTLEGRVDWDALEEMEQQAKSVIEGAIEHYDNPIIGFSGGIDCTVLVQMVKELGYEDDVLSVSIVNPMYHDSIKTWCEAFPESRGFETDIDVNEDRDMAWVEEHEDICLYPTWANKQYLLNSGYRDHFTEYNEEHDVGVFFSGRRNEVNLASKYFDERWGSVECRPIYYWTIEHVVAYCDKHDLPICPFYFEFPSTGGYPWYRRRLWSKYGTQIRTKEQWWYWTRRICLRAGYTNFWKMITDTYPQGEEMAHTHAADADILILDLEDGYNYGLDAVEDPMDVQPAHLDFHREQLLNRDDSHDWKNPEGNYRTEF